MALAANSTCIGAYELYCLQMPVGNKNSCSNDPENSQGAHCYVRMDPPSLRKYAFHLVLAGHRYSKAGQRKHALRCYKNAWDIFKGKYHKVFSVHSDLQLKLLLYSTE